MGFEPTDDSMPPAVFKTAAFNHSATLPLEPVWRFEPQTCGLQIRCSAIEPHRHIPGERELPPGTFKGGYAVIPNSNTRLYTPSKGSFSWIRHGRGRTLFCAAAEISPYTATFILPHVQNPFSVFCKKLRPQ